MTRTLIHAFLDAEFAPLKASPTMLRTNLVLGSLVVATIILAPLQSGLAERAGVKLRPAKEQAPTVLSSGEWILPISVVQRSILISRPLAEKAAKITEAESCQGFVELFDGKTFDGWEQGGNWRIEDGAFFRASGGGALTYKRKMVPDNFELRFDWKVSKGCNSGVYYRPGQVEYQVLDNVGSPYGENPRQSAASLFFCMAPSKDATRPVGEWNSGRVVCKGTVIQHWLNGQKVLDFDYTDPKWAEMVKLLTIRGGDLSGRGGELWLQDHGQPVWYRNFRWREIPNEEQLKPSPDFKPMPIPPAALAKEQQRVQKMLEQAKAK